MHSSPDCSPSYCSAQDLSRAMPAQTLIWLSADDEAASAPNEAVIAQALGSAHELIDAHLRARYALPLPHVPPLLRELAVNLARHWLYARRPEGNELPEAVVRTHKAAISMLADIRDARLHLGLPPGQQSQLEPSVMKVRARKRVFSPQTLGGYG